MKTAISRAFVVALLAWFDPGVAHASPEFPEEMQEALEMPCAPPCTICHRNNEGGIGTATKPFAEAMGGAGLRDTRPETVAPALQVLESEQTDSDQDGVLDVDELREGADPNRSGSSLVCPSYGCGARIETRSPVDARAAVAALSVALVLAASLRRRAASSRR